MSEKLHMLFVLSAFAWCLPVQLPAEPLSFTIETTSVTTIAGMAGVKGYEDGKGSAVRFDEPQAMTSDGTHLYIADLRNGVIRKVDTVSNAVSTFVKVASRCIASDGEYLYVKPRTDEIVMVSIPTGEMKTLRLTAEGRPPHTLTVSVAGLVIDSDSLYISDMGNHSIGKISLSTGEIETIAGFRNKPGSADGLGTGARFNSPGDLAIIEDNLYVIDYDNYTIREINLTTYEVRTIAGSTGQRGIIDGPAKTARFNRPTALLADGTDLYITDVVLRKLDLLSMNVSTVAGSRDAIAASDGNGEYAGLYVPRDMVRMNGALYILEKYSIRKVTSDPKSRDTVIQTFSLNLVPKGAHEKFDGRVLSASNVIKAFPLAPEPREFMKITRLPTLTTPAYSSIGFGRSVHDRSFTIVADVKSIRESRIFVDANANGDLTDDPDVEWTVSPYESSTKYDLYAVGGAWVQTPWEEQNRVFVRFYNFYQEGKELKSIRYTHDYYREGFIQINGMKYKVYLLDLLNVGDYRGRSSIASAYPISGIFIAIDIDNNGEISEKTELFDIRSVFVIESASYRVANTSQSGDRITITKIP